MQLHQRRRYMPTRRSRGLKKNSRISAYTEQLLHFSFSTNEVEENFGPLVLIRLANGPVALLVMEKKYRKMQIAQGRQVTDDSVSKNNLHTGFNLKKTHLQISAITISDARFLLMCIKRLNENALSVAVRLTRLLVQVLTPP